MEARISTVTSAPASILRKAEARARQYVLMPSSVPFYPQWKSTAFGSNFCLHYDHRLHVSVCDGAVLLGSIYDLELDTMAVDAILSDVARYIPNEMELYERLSHLAGRWTFFRARQGNVKIVSDATGLLPVFYIDSQHAPLVSCNPELIAELANAPVSNAGRKRMTEPSYRSDAPTELPLSGARGHDNWWPGELTPYRGIRHLLPNHCLELPSRRVSRFWPSRSVNKISEHSAASEASRQLNLIVQGVSKSRGKVLMPLSAGLDTRALLATSKSVVNRLSHFVFSPAVHKSGNSFVEDRMIARKISQKHGFPVTELEYSNVLDDEFGSRLKSNVSFLTASHTIGFEMQAVTRAFGSDATLLNGNVSEIARNYYGFFPKSLVNESYLTCATDIDLSPLTCSEFRRWLPAARSASDLGQIELSDLLYWEFRMGCWYAYAQLQIGAFFEIFTPFNCRKLLEVLLSAPKKSRSGVVAPLYRNIILQCWPQLLQTPINPSKSGSYRVRAAAFIRGYDRLNFGAKSIWYGYKRRSRRFRQM